MSTVTVIFSNNDSQNVTFSIAGMASSPKHFLFPHHGQEQREEKDGYFNLTL